MTCETEKKVGDENRTDRLPYELAREDINAEPTTVVATTRLKASHDSKDGLTLIISCA